MPDPSSNNPLNDPAAEAVREIELTDEDILDAMQHIPGYLDISTEDFRGIYHLAHQHALGRIFSHVRAGNLMRVGIEPLHPDMPLYLAAKAHVRSGYKALPVVDDSGCVIGILTESDFLRRFKVDNFLELLLGMMDETFEFRHRCHETPVSEAMTAPAVTVTREAGYREIFAAFHHHNGRSLPVVDQEGRLQGLLLRKDFINAYHQESLR